MERKNKNIRGKSLFVFIVFWFYNFVPYSCTMSPSIFLRRNVPVKNGKELCLTSDMDIHGIISDI
jgi:hypothetical protein